RCYVRRLQCAWLHADPMPQWVRPIAERCDGLLPNRDGRVNRELATLLTHFRRSGVLTTPVHAKLLDALKASADARQQQIHYFYCLRLIGDSPWTAQQKDDLLAWYDATKTWTGGASDTPVLGE